MRDLSVPGAVLLSLVSLCGAPGGAEDAEAAAEAVSTVDGSGAAEVLRDFDELLSDGKTKKAFRRVSDAAAIRIVQCDGEQTVDADGYRQIFDDLHQAVETYRRTRESITAASSEEGRVVLRSVLHERLEGPGFAGDGVSDEEHVLREDGGTWVLESVVSRARCEAAGSADVPDSDVSASEADEAARAGAG